MMELISKFVVTLILIFIFYALVVNIFIYLKKIFHFFLKNKQDKISFSDNYEQKKTKITKQVSDQKPYKRVKREKSTSQIKYEQKYKDLGIKIPKPNNRKYGYINEIWSNPIVPRLTEYNIADIKNNKIENTKIAKLLLEIINYTKEPISDVIISGLNGYAKKADRIKYQAKNNEKKYFEHSYGYSKKIAKAYSIRFRPENWKFHQKLKSYDDYFQDLISRGEEPPPFKHFVDNVIKPIGKELYKYYQDLINKHAFMELGAVNLSPPHGQKITIIVYLLTTSEDLVFYNQPYLTDFGKQNIKKIATELDKIFKRKNVSLHHCYEDSKFRDTVLRIAENNFRTKNNMPKVGEGWTSQTDLFNRLKKYFPNIEKEYSPKWIKPKRIDIFIKNFKVAIEYHGFQHYSPTSFFGGVEAFKKRQIDDKKKEEKCLKNKVSFIEWPYDVKINNKNILKLKNYIIKNEKKVYSINIKRISIK